MEMFNISDPSHRLFIPTRKSILRPRLLDSIDRLKRFIEVDAPAVVIGHEIWLLFRVTLACYGPVASGAMINHLIEKECINRGLCYQVDCTSPPTKDGLCAEHNKEIDAMMGEEEAFIAGA